MSAADLVYADMLRAILRDGNDRTDRTGVGTRSIFGGQARFNLRDGFPLLTTKRLHFKSIARELLWFISGETHVEPLQRAGVSIWDEWATPEQCARFGRPPGDLGPVYGHQWRNFGGTYNGEAPLRAGFDQLAWVVAEIVRNPDSRRLIVTGWNPAEAAAVALPPCHTLFQFYVVGNRLSCHLYQRSADVFLGVPFNIASYALLTHLVAHATSLDVGDFVHSFGDLHLYRTHFDQAHEQLLREPLAAPQLAVLAGAPRDLFALRFPEHFVVADYHSHGVIKAPVAV